MKRETIIAVVIVGWIIYLVGAYLFLTQGKEPLPIRVAFTVAIGAMAVGLTVRML